MKRYIKALVLIPVMLISCYWIDVGNWNKRVVSLNSLLNNVPSDVMRIHVAVFEGYPSSDNLLQKSIFYPGTNASLELNAGSNRWFLIVGETYEGFAKYSGLSGPYNMSEGGTTNVFASMSIIDITLTAVPGPSYMEWDSVPGAATYEVDRSYGNNTGPWELEQISPVTRYYSAKAGSDYIRVRAYYEIFTLYSVYGTEAALWL